MIKYKPKYLIKFILFILIILFCVSGIVGCISMSINKNNYVAQKIDYQSTIYCDEIKIIASFSQEIENLKEIIMKKLLFQLTKQGKLKYIEEKDNAQYIIIPELIIKKYSENFLDNYFYRFSLQILSSETVIAHFVYEYSGNLSIFNNKLLESFINSFINDLLKIVKNK